MIYLTSEEFIDFLCRNIEMPVRTKEETLALYKTFVDGTPDKWLQFHLVWCEKEEEYELAAYIRDVAKKRGVVLA